MKKFLLALAAFLLLVTPAYATTLFPTGGGTGSTTLSGILLGNGVSPVNTLTVGSGLSLTGTTLATTGSSASSTLLGDTNTWSGNNTFSNTITGSISGNAGTVTNGVYTTTFNGLFDPRFITDLAATTSVKSIATLPSLSLPYSQLTGTPNIASSTLLGDSNTFSGTLNKFTNAPALAVSGLLKGNGSSAITAAANGTDFTLITAKTCNAGDFVSSLTAVGVFSCTTPAGTTYTGTFPIVVTGTVISSAFSTTSNSGMAQGFQYVGSGGIFQTASASSSFFGYTPLNPIRQLTVAGTANQLTSSAGAQDLSADRTWTFSLPNHVIFPGNFQVANSTTTNATTTSLAVLGSTTVGAIFQGGGLTTCNGTSALTYSGTAFTCAAQPQGTVTSVSGTANQVTSTGGATPVIALNSHVSFGAGGYESALGSTTNATSTNLTVTASTTLGTVLNGAGLTSCNGASNALTWNAGAFGCNTITASGGAFPFVPGTNFGVAVNSTTTLPINFTQGIFASSTSKLDTLFVGSSTPQAYTNAPLVVTGNTNNYVQLVLQNLNAGTTASADFILGGNLMTNSIYYGNLGYNSSANTDSSFTAFGANALYLYNSDGELDLGTATSTGSAGVVKFFTNGTLAANERARFTQTGLFGIGTTTPSQVLSVQGNGLFSGNLSAANLTATGTVIFSGITGTQCLHAVSGTVSGTGSDCGSGSSVTGTTGQTAYLSGTNTAVGTSTLFIGANGQLVNKNGDVLGQEASYIVSTSTWTGQFTSIQSAIDALPSTGGLIHIRCGVYTLPTATYGILVKVANTVIEGEGNCTQLNMDKANTANAFGMNATALTGVELGRLFINQTNGTFGGIGVNASNTPLIYVHDIKFFGLGTTTVSTDSVNATFYQHFSNLDMRDNNSCIQIGSPTSNPVNDNSYDGYLRCGMHAGNNGNGLYIDSSSANGSQSINLQNFNSEPVGSGTGLTAIRLNKAVDIHLTNAYVEGNALGYNISSSAQRIDFIGGEFVSNTSYINSGSNVQFIGTDKESVALNQFMASTSIVDVTGNDASVPSFSIYGNNNFAKASDLIRLMFDNSTDSGAGLHIINPGTGPSIKVESGQSAFAVGTALKPAITFFSDLATGLFQAVSGTLSFVTAGVEKARILANGNFGIGTTTPQWILNVASSTVAQLALSSNSSSGNFHWTVNNVFGNLFFATSSPGTFATSTNSNPNVGYIEFPNNGGCVGCTDIVLPDGINLRNAMYVDATSTNVAANTLTDVYTAPAGRRALVSSAQMVSFAGTSVAFTSWLKDSGNYYRLTATSTASALAAGHNIGYVLEPGESIAVYESAVASNLLSYSIVEYDASVPFFSAKIFNAGTATTTLYTAPAGVTAGIVNCSTPLVPASSPNICASNTNLTGVSSLVSGTFFAVKSGQVASYQSNVLSPQSTLTSFAVNTFLLATLRASGAIYTRNSGDSIQYSTANAASFTGNSIMWVDVVEH